MNHPRHSKKLVSIFFSRNMLICLFNGLSAGMPLFYSLHLIPAWLRSEGVDLKTIGLFALVGMPYTWKFLWSPFLDRFVPPFLGRRRGWMIVSQIVIMITMISFALYEPQKNILLIAYTAVALAFFSATQDIVLDAYRRELLPDEELGLGNAMYVNGYRAAVFIPGGLGLVLADYLSWPLVHFVIALFMLIGVVKTLMIREVKTNIVPPKTLYDAVVKPFYEFIHRDGLKQALLILAFLLLYKMGDNMATALSTPFYLDLGFSKTEIGTMVKLINFWAMFIGGLMGGAMIYKIGINKCLWVFGVAQMLPILGFAALSEVGKSLSLLAVVIGSEYLGVGLGTAAFVAFMARTTNKNFTATQFALLSSLIAVPRSLANAVTGFIIEGISVTDGIYYQIFGEVSGLGYTRFFLFCTACAIPGLILLKWVAPWHVTSQEQTP
ncbi:MAG: AmpG family muropeptide MFS transporter [Deltaproteobacteria bacterium]|nr:AmpG family muropeptide MFS transporter [Deltaproteobacteria bacterium]